MKREFSPAVESVKVPPYLTDEQLDRLLPSEGFEILRPGDLVKSSGQERLTKRHRVTAAGEEIEEVQMADLVEGDGQTETVGDAKKRRVKQFLTGVLVSSDNRKNLGNALIHEANKLGVDLVIDEILRLYLDITIADLQRHSLVKILDCILLKYRTAVATHASRILATLAPTLLDADAAVRTETAGIIGNLAKAVGLAVMLTSLRPDVDHVDDYVRLAASKIVGILGYTLGVETILPFIKALCRSKKSPLAKQTGLRSIQQLAISAQSGLLLYLDDVLSILTDVFAELNQPLQPTTTGAPNAAGAAVLTAALTAAGGLAELLRARGVRDEEGPDGVGAKLMNSIAEIAKRSRGGRVAVAALKTVGELLGILEKEKAEWLSRDVLYILKRHLNDGEEPQKKAAIKLISRLVISDDLAVWEDLTRVFFGSVWSGGRFVATVAADKRAKEDLVNAVNKLASFCLTDVLNRLISSGLKEADGEVRDLALLCLARIDANFDQLTGRMEEQLIDGLVHVFQSATPTASTSTSTSISVQLFRMSPLAERLGRLIRKLGVTRMVRHSQTVGGSIRWRLNQASAAGRRLGAEMLTTTADVLEEGTVRTLGLVVFEFLGEDDPETLSWLLRALDAVIGRLGESASAVVRDVVPRVTPILRHRQAAVQAAAVSLLGRCAEIAGDQVGAKEWLRIALELVEMLRSPRKSVRRSAMRCVGGIAKTIGPAEVLTPLLNQLKYEERGVKIGAAVGLAVVATECGAFTVLPALMNEYKSDDLQIRTGILKTINFMVEMLDPVDMSVYMDALTPLLEHALIDRDLVHRHTAAWTLKHAALAVRGTGKEDVLMHLLNYLFPNILETAPHMTQAFFDSIDALRLALGPAPILSYLVTGLFHPARRVRDAYWRVYNFLLYSCQHALVPAYPPSLHGEEMTLCL